MDMETDYKSELARACEAIETALGRLTDAVTMNDGPYLGRLEAILDELRITLDAAIRNRVFYVSNTTDVKYIQHPRHGKHRIIGWHCGESGKLDQVGHPITASDLAFGWSYGYEPEDLKND